MRPLFAAVLFCVALPTLTAHAGERKALPPPAAALDRAHQPARPLAEPSPWRGFYLGLSGGTASANPSYDIYNPNIVTSTPIAHDADGRAFGFQAGALVPWGPVVFGAELAYVYADLDSSIDYVNNNSPHTAVVEIDHLMLLTGRVGVPIDSVLPYVKAGFGLAHLNLAKDHKAPLIHQASSRLEPAFAWGGGLEYRAGRNLTLAFDWTRLDLDGPGPRPYGPANVVAADLAGAIDLFMLRLNYQLK